MKLLFVKTSEVDINMFLKFCFNKLKTHIKNINLVWDKTIKEEYIFLYSISHYILINEKGKIIGNLDKVSDKTSSGLNMWNIRDIHEIPTSEIQCFNIDKYSNIINDSKYKPIKIGLNDMCNWVYMIIENKMTNYRDFLINLDSLENLKKYIRVEKINKIFN